jgi:EAL domain-containing protein (putative c-di-GMP-specific phosphodiesterase class I)
MGLVTDLVVATALDDAAQWHAAGVGTPVAVNLFAPLLGDLDLPRRVSRALAERGLDGSALTVEITEDLFLSDLTSTKAVLADLRERGIRISVDDFGSGYSALSYLSDLPIDEVKIDHDFMVPAMTDQRAATVVGAAVDLAHRLGLVTVAEGIENAEMAQRMRDFGCDVLQGYYLSAPLTAEELLSMLRSRGSGYPEISSSILEDGDDGKQ